MGFGWSRRKLKFEEGKAEGVEEGTDVVDEENN